MDVSMAESEPAPTSEPEDTPPVPSSHVSAHNGTNPYLQQLVPHPYRQTATARAGASGPHSSASLEAAIAFSDLVPLGFQLRRPKRGRSLLSSEASEQTDLNESFEKMTVNQAEEEMILDEQASNDTLPQDDAPTSSGEEEGQKMDLDEAGPSAALIREIASASSDLTSSDSMAVERSVLNEVVEKHVNEGAVAKKDLTRQTAPTSSGVEEFEKDVDQVAAAKDILTQGTSPEPAAIPNVVDEFRQYINGHVEDFKVQFSEAHKKRDPTKRPRQDTSSSIHFIIPFCLPPDPNVVSETTKNLAYEAQKVVYLHWCIRQPEFQKHLLKAFKARAALDKQIAEDWLPRNWLFVFMDLKPRLPGVHPYDSMLTKRNDFWVHVVVPKAGNQIGPDKILPNHNRWPCLLTTCDTTNEMESNSSFPACGLSTGMKNAAEFQSHVDNDCRDFAKAAGEYFGGQQFAEYEMVAIDCASKRKKLEEWRRENVILGIEARIAEEKAKREAEKEAKKATSKPSGRGAKGKPEIESQDSSDEADADEDRHDTPQLEKTHPSNIVPSAESETNSDDVEEMTSAANTSEVGETVMRRSEAEPQSDEKKAANRRRSTQPHNSNSNSLKPPTNAAVQAEQAKQKLKTPKTSGRSTLKGAEAVSMSALTARVDSWMGREVSSHMSNAQTGGVSSVERLQSVVEAQEELNGSSLHQEDANDANGSS